MLTKEINTVTNFVAPQFKDMLIMVDIMNKIAEKINANRLCELRDALDPDTRDMYCFVHVPDIDCNNLEHVFEVLCNVGFQSTVELKEPTIKDLKLK